ncbi:hypothetical protein DVK02_14610 [Halobellus sp. Atlit-31R]|nr:hypothetical protein DVK02_14610 [Halobellus sp. Atlit-31R]
MSHSRPTQSVSIDPLKTALGVFVLVGLALTAVAAYALVDTMPGGVGALPPELVMTFVFGAALLATGAAVRRVIPER